MYHLLVQIENFDLGNLCEISVWQHVQLSEQISPANSVFKKPCWWNVFLVLFVFGRSIDVFDYSSTNTLTITILNNVVKMSVNSQFHFCHYFG